jgi:hemolysin activation/secretion protein
MRVFPKRWVMPLLAGWLACFAGPVLVAQEVPVVRFTVDRFEVAGENPLSPDEVDETLAPYLGDHEGLERLLAAADALQNRLHAAGYTFLRVGVPQQTVAEGVVRLNVVAFEVGRIEITGNKYFSDGNILRSVPALEPGATPNTRTISRQLVLANEHPSKHIEVKFGQGQAQGTVDGRVEVTDRRPYSLFAVLNNTGTDETDDSRLTLGAQHSNLFDRDQAATFTYTTSPREPSKVKQFGVHYRWPLYQFSGALSAFWVDSDVDSGLVADAFDVSGAGRFWGLDYTQLFHSLGRYRHRATLRVEDKFFDPTVLFNNMPLPPGFTGITPVRSRPLTLRYEATYPFREGSVRGYVSYVHNLPGGSKNDSTSYEESRPFIGIDNNWDAWRLGGGFTRALPASFVLQGRIDGQISDEPLISGEQFGVGGASSVRGYDERQVSGDSGYAASLEVWSPALKYNTRLLGFVDYGYRTNKNPQPGEVESETLASLGAGLRWTWKQSFSAQVDFARTLNEAGGVGEGHTKLHFNLLYRY